MISKVGQLLTSKTMLELAKIQVPKSAIKTERTDSEVNESQLYEGESNAKNMPYYTPRNNY